MGGLGILNCAVMFMGCLVYGVSYSVPEYLCTFLVAGGVSTFALLKVRNKLN
jgi:UDP-galactose transporter B1